MITTNLKKKTKGWKLKMCGIVGITGKDNAVEIMINGLEKLEYRGYDSAGIYVNNGNGNQNAPAGADHGRGHRHPVAQAGGRPGQGR